MISSDQSVLHREMVKKGAPSRAASMNSNASVGSDVFLELKTET